MYNDKIPAANMPQISIRVNIIILLSGISRILSLINFFIAFILTSLLPKVNISWHSSPISSPDSNRFRLKPLPFILRIPAKKVLCKFFPKEENHTEVPFLLFSQPARFPLSCRHAAILFVTYIILYSFAAFKRLFLLQSEGCFQFRKLSGVGKAQHNFISACPLCQSVHPVIIARLIIFPVKECAVKNLHIFIVA